MFCVSIRSFFKKQSSLCSSSSASTSTSSTSTNQAATYFDNGDTMQVEIRHAFKVVDNNYSYNSVDDDNKRFQKMFADSKIAQQYCMKSDKLAYIVNFGLPPYFKDILLFKIKQSLFLAISFDESYCKAIQKNKWMS